MKVYKEKKKENFRLTVLLSDESEKISIPANKNITEESMRKEIIREIEDTKRNVIADKNAASAPNYRAKLEQREKEIQHMLGRLNDKNSDIYNFFMLNAKTKLDEARKNSSLAIDLNYPERSDINQEEINTSRVEGELEGEQGLISGIYEKNLNNNMLGYLLLIILISINAISKDFGARDILSSKIEYSNKAHGCFGSSGRVRWKDDYEKKYELVKFEGKVCRNMLDNRSLEFHLDSDEDLRYEKNDIKIFSIFNSIDQINDVKIK